MNRFMKISLCIALFGLLVAVSFGQTAKEIIHRAIDQDLSICVNVSGSDKCITLLGASGNLNVVEHIVLNDGTDRDATIEFDGPVDSKWRMDSLSSIGTPTNGFRIRDVDRGVDVIQLNENGAMIVEASTSTTSVFLSANTGDGAHSGVGINNESVLKMDQANAGTSCAVQCEGLGSAGDCICFVAKRQGTGALGTCSDTTNNRSCGCLCDDF